jgi:hypothetical protein
MTPEMMAEMFADHPEPDPEVAAAMDAVYRKQAEIEIAWRKIYAGQWAFLFCTCKRRRMFSWKPSHQPVSSGCMVHGQFLISPKGEIL